MKKLIVFLSVLLLIGVMNLSAHQNDTVRGDPPVGAPIDGAVVVLLIAGAAFGVRKLKPKKLS